jgi:tetraprenyl-beta-curcumene synthase
VPPLRLPSLSETSFGFLFCLFSRILPKARREISHWTAWASTIPDAELRHQALASLCHKRFHADGGCVYAALAPPGPADLVRLIIALQTISDYLDNLCDRCGRTDERDFEQLHHAMRDAVRPDAPLRPYYAYHDRCDDGGYLSALVQTCQAEVRRLPGYTAAQPYVTWLIERYCELQQYKHIQVEARAQRLKDWYERFREQFPQLNWWEFSAAAGSTLGIFSLFTAAQRPLATESAKALFRGYFPWLCGLHILLDYWIDLAEDRAHGDFNFVACYPSWSDAYGRLRRFADESRQRAHRLFGGRIHAHVVKGLLAMYLSDKKAILDPQVRPTRRLVWRFGPTAWMFYGACLLYRRVR